MFSSFSPQEQEELLDTTPLSRLMGLKKRPEVLAKAELRKDHQRATHAEAQRWKSNTKRLEKLQHDFFQMLQEQKDPYFEPALWSYKELAQRLVQQVHQIEEEPINEREKREAHLERLVAKYQDAFLHLPIEKRKATNVERFAKTLALKEITVTTASATPVTAPVAHRELHPRSQLGLKILSLKKSIKPPKKSNLQTQAFNLEEDVSTLQQQQQQTLKIYLAKRFTILKTQFQALLQAHPHLRGEFFDAHIPNRNKKIAQSLAYITIHTELTDLFLSSMALKKVNFGRHKQPQRGLGIADYSLSTRKHCIQDLIEREKKSFLEKLKHEAFHYLKQGEIKKYIEGRAEIVEELQKNSTPFYKQLKSANYNIETFYNHHFSPHDVVFTKEEIDFISDFLLNQLPKQTHKRLNPQFRIEANPQVLVYKGEEVIPLHKWLADGLAIERFAQNYTLSRFETEACKAATQQLLTLESAFKK